MTDNEILAKDLAIAYELLFQLKYSDKDISPDGFYLNYQENYNKFLEVINSNN